MPDPVRGSFSAVCCSFFEGTVRVVVGREGVEVGEVTATVEVER